ncbi:MAG: Arc family DNA-binding protein [Gammaproteobacteria bacterium]|nr:Arc family DNA-binding protein [Gammaproteobacteria bacterium]
MPNITLKNIPDQLYSKLKQSAEAHHRSLNSEILYCVEKALGTTKIDISTHIETARKLRLKTVSHPLLEEELNQAKNMGRP